MHAQTAWDLKFQVCLGYTFTPATLVLFINLNITLACCAWEQGFIVTLEQGTLIKGEGSVQLTSSLR